MAVGDDALKLLFESRLRSRYFSVFDRGRVDGVGPADTAVLVVEESGVCEADLYGVPGIRCSAIFCNNFLYSSVI